MPQHEDGMQDGTASRSRPTRRQFLRAAGVGALAGGTTWARVLVAGLGVRVAAEIAIAMVAYRRTMSRPWPPVAPLADDDWD
jgi:hypothetical protein